MIKTLLIAVWVIVIALSSSFFSAKLSSENMKTTQTEQASGPIEFIKSEMISVPVIRDSKVQGYVVAQFTFAMDQSVVAKLNYEPSPFLVDAAFRSLYGDQTTDFTNLRQQDLDTLTKHIAEKITAKLGVPITKEVLLNEINYVARDEVRTNWVKK